MNFFSTLFQLLGGSIMLLATFREYLPNLWTKFSTDADPLAQSVLAGGLAVFLGGAIISNQLRIRALEKTVEELEGS